MAAHSKVKPKYLYIFLWAVVINVEEESVLIIRFFFYIHKVVEMNNQIYIVSQLRTNTSDLILQPCFILHSSAHAAYLANKA